MGRALAGAIQMILRHRTFQSHLLCHWLCCRHPRLQYIKENRSIILDTNSSEHGLMRAQLVMESCLDSESYEHVLSVRYE